VWLDEIGSRGEGISEPSLIKLLVYAPRLGRNEGLVVAVR